MITALKTTLAGIALATGIAAGATSAQAGGSLGFHIDSHGNASISLRFGDHHGGWGSGGRSGGRKCSKGEALGKAAALHVKNRWVQSVGTKNIVVRGTLYGDDVKVVMKRNSAHCAVKSVSYV